MSETFLDKFDRVDGVPGTSYTVKVTVTPAPNDPFFGFGKIPKVVA